MEISFIRSSYIRFYQQHKEEIDRAIQSCLERGELTLREEVWNLEKTLEGYVGSQYAVGVNSCTDALFLSLKALGVREGDEVITVSHTFIAPIQAIVHCGATPILVDVKEDELMDVAKLEGAITKRTKVIMPVHLTGKVCNMAAIMNFVEDYGIKIIEDAAQALGATRDGYRAGSRGITGCFSFNNAKMLGAYGDGGAIVTDNEEIYKKLLLLRNHWNMSQLSVRGEDYPQPEILGWGWKSRLDNIQAAVLNVKFKYIDEIIERRKKIAEYYNAQLWSLNGVVIPTTQEGQVWQEYHLQIIGDRGAFVEKMKEKGIELLVRDIIPNHKQKGLGLDHFNLPVTELFAKTIVRLPLYPELTEDEIQYVVDSIKGYAK